MTGTSIADPLAQSYISVVHRLLDELTANVEKTARIAELEAELARRDAYQAVVTSVVNEAFAAEALDEEALECNLPAFPVPFPNRFPIWDAWSDVPDGVVYESVDEGSIAHWVNRDGVRMIVDQFTVWPGGFFPREMRSGNSENEMSELAPFVEVK